MGGGGSQTVGYRYFMGLHLGVCQGPVDALLEIRAGDRTAWSGSQTSSGSLSISAPDLFGGEDREGGLQGTLDVMMGESAQTANSYLSSLQGTPQPAYRGILGLVYRSGLVSCNNPYVKPWAVRVRRILSGWDGETVWYSGKASITLGSIQAMNPAHIVYQCLTDRRWGMGRSSGGLDLASFQACADTFYSEGMGLCLAYRQQGRIENFIQQVLDHCGAAVGEDPSTGLIRMKALRADYSVGSLPVYSPDAGNIVDLEEFERASPAEAVNEITVQYSDGLTGKTASVTVQHLASVQAQGGSTPTTKQYPGLPTNQLATRIALRDLAATASGLARVKFSATRAAFGLLPGDVIAFSWPALGVSLMPLRIGKVDYGSYSSGVIGIEAVQDVFGLPSTTYISPQSGLWSEASRTPVAPSAYAGFEIPYRELARIMGPSNSALLDPDAGFIGTVAARPSTTLSVNYRMDTRVGSATYAEADSGDWCPGGVLAVAVTPLDTSLSLSGFADLDLVSIGQAILVEAEIMKITAIDVSGGTITVGRGCADTVPAAHASGVRVWLFEQFAAFDQTEYATGEAVDAKIRTRTSSGLLALGSSPNVTVTMAQRAYRPYPPGKLLLNGASYPATVAGYADLVVTGAHRDRLLQQDQLIDTTQTDIGPEAGTTYSGELRNADTNALLSSVSGLTTPSTTFPLSVIGTAVNLRVKLWSVRGGLASTQQHSWDAQRVNADGSPWVPGSGTTPPLDTMFYENGTWWAESIIAGPPSATRLYRSTDGATFEFSANLYGANMVERNKRGLASSGSLYVSVPVYYNETYPPASSLIYYTFKSPRLTLSDSPALWSTSTAGPLLCIAWDAANSRFVGINSSQQLVQSTTGTTWAYVSTLTVPAFTWYQGMRFEMWKDGSTWFLLHSALHWPGEGQYDADSTMLMKSTNLTTWTICPGTGHYSTPPGEAATWNIHRMLCAASRGSTVVVSGYVRRVGAVSTNMRTIVLRSTDGGASFSIAYEAAAVHMALTSDGQAYGDYYEIDAVGSNGFVASGPNGLLVSTDGGATWTASSMSPFPKNLRSNGSRVVGTRATRSVSGGYVAEPWYTDDGTTWTLCTVRQYRTGSHRYWRLKVQESVGAVDVQLAELAFYNTTTLLTGYSKTAGFSTTIGNIDDANNSTSCDPTVAQITAGDAWIAYDFGSAVTVTAAELRIGSTTTRAPKRLEVQWSDDGTTWNSGWYEEGLTWTAGENKRLESAS